MNLITPSGVEVFQGHIINALFVGERGEWIRGVLGDSISTDRPGGDKNQDHKLQP
jgi:hypothetical protein